MFFNFKRDNNLGNGYLKLKAATGYYIAEQTTRRSE